MPWAPGRFLRVHDEYSAAQNNRCLHRLPLLNTRLKQPRIHLLLQLSGYIVWHLTGDLYLFYSA